MPQRRGILSGMVLTAALAGPAAPAPTTAPASAPATGPATRPAGGIEALIADLSASSWQARQKAQDALAAMGQPARPRLMQLLRESKDEEARSRAEAALRQIEESGSTSVSQITLHLSNATPQRAFAELSRQADAAIVPNPVNLWESKPWPAITLDAERQPFWAVMRSLCEKAGVVPQYRGTGLDREMLVGVRGPLDHLWGDGPVALSGPFMFVPATIYTNRSVDMARPKDIRRLCHIQMLVYPEPKIRVLRASLRAVIEQAVDDRGNPMGVSGDMPDAMPMGVWARNLSLSLNMPDGRAERIARLKGYARFVVQTRSQEAEIADVLSAANVTRTVAGRRFILKDVRRSGDNYVVRMGLFQKDWSNEEWMRLYPGQLFRLYDTRGIPFQRLPGAAPPMGQDQSEITLVYQRPLAAGAGADPQPGEPAKLAWEVPTESREIRVPFEFRDLPLP